MTSEADPEIQFGLSQEEREDLYKLMGTLSDETPLAPDGGQPGSSSQKIDERMRDMSSCLEDFSERVLQLDVKMKSTSSYVDDRMRHLGSTIVGFSDKLLKLDTQMKAFYKILLLSQKKTELMNEHINAILEMTLDREGHL